MTKTKAQSFIGNTLKQVTEELNTWLSSLSSLDTEVIGISHSTYIDTTIAYPTPTFTIIVIYKTSIG